MLDNQIALRMQAIDRSARVLDVSMRTAQTDWRDHRAQVKELAELLLERNKLSSAPPEIVAIAETWTAAA